MVHRLACAVQWPPLCGNAYRACRWLLSRASGINDTEARFYYTGCAQVYLDSAETTLPKDVVSIPGHIQAGDPSLQFNISAPSLPYTVPGPSVYASNVSPTVQQANLPLQGEGLLPPNGVLTNGNWFGIELAPYSTAEGCKNVSRTLSSPCSISINEQTGHSIMLQPIYCMLFCCRADRNS